MKIIVSAVLLLTALFGTDQFEMGVAEYDKKEFRKAKTFFKKACESGDAHGCFNLGFMYSKGLGTTKDDKRAFGAYKKACNGGVAEGCNDLALAYDYARGTNEDKAAALKYYKTACAIGYQKSCDNHAKLKKRALKKWITIIFYS